MSERTSAPCSLKRLAARAGDNRVVRAGSVAGAIKAAGLVAAFFLQMLLARIIADPAEYGVYAWGQNLLFLLGSVFALGIPLASSRLAAVHAQRGDRVQLEAVERSGFRWLALAALGGAGISLVVVLSLPTGSFDELPRQIALLAVAASPLVAFTLFNQALARARSRLTAAFLPTQVLRPLFSGLLALAWFLWIGRGPTAIEVLLAISLSLALVFGVQLLLVRNRPETGTAVSLPSPPRSPEGSYGSERIMHNALPIFATRLSDLLIQYGSVFVLGLLGGPLAAAGYFVADRLGQLASVPRSVISSVVQPWMAGAHAQGDRHRLQQVVTQAGHTTLWPTLAITVALLVLGPLLLGLFGAEYRAAFDVLVVLLCAHLFGAALGPAQQVLMMSGLQTAVVRVMILAAVCHLLVLVVLIPWLGALGAAIATLASTTLARAGCLRLVRSRLGLEPSLIRGFTRTRPPGESNDDPK